MEANDAWHWLGDGEDHLENLMYTVLIEADDLRKLLYNEKKAGVEEVVEWIKSTRLTPLPKGQHSKGITLISNAQLQAKLKEWGIEK